jgi:subfamily B ATP-binding cassette protein MsbA
MLKKWLVHKRLIGLSNLNIFLMISLSLVASVLEALGLSMFYPVFKMLQKDPVNDNSDDYGILENIQSVFNFIGVEFSLLTVLVSVFLLLIFRQVFTYSKNVYTFKLVYVISMHLRNTLFYNFLFASANYQDNIAVGEVSNVVNREIPNAVSGVISPLTLVTYLIFLFILVIMLLALSMKITIVVFFVLAVSSLVTRTWINKSKTVGRKVVTVNSDINSFLIERLNSTRLISLSNTKVKESAKFKDLSKRQKDLSISASVLNSKTEAVLDPLVVGISLLFLYVSYTFAGMSIEAIGLYMIIFMRMLPLVKGIVQTWQKVKGAFGAIEIVEKRINEIYAHKEGSKGDIEFTGIKDRIVYRDVSYSYSSKKIINKLSIDIKKSSSVAIVGPSGGGKTTIIELLSRLRKPLSGELLIDGINIDNFTLESLRGMISYVQQDPQILPGTISDHISYGAKNKTAADIENAAKISGAHEFIESMPNGYNSLLKDNANNLSGGQRQRIDLARAILHSNSVLVLDEPTSNLDIESQNYFVKSIENLARINNITLIVIAHSLFSIMNFDKILVVQQGKILEEGTHSELMNNDNGWYKVSWSLQSNGHTTV